MFFPEYEESENHPEFQHLEVPPWRKSKVPDSRELAWPSQPSLGPLLLSMTGFTEHQPSYWIVKVKTKTRPFCNHV